MRALLAHGADVAAHYPVGRSTIELAKEKGFHKIAALLLKHAAET